MRNYYQGATQVLRRPEPRHNNLTMRRASSMEMLESENAEYIKTIQDKEIKILEYTINFLNKEMKDATTELEKQEISQEIKKEKEKMDIIKEMDINQYKSYKTQEKERIKNKMKEMDSIFSADEREIDEAAKQENDPFGS